VAFAFVRLDGRPSTDADGGCTSARWIGEHHPALDAVHDDYDAEPLTGFLGRVVQAACAAFPRAEQPTQE
jgi:hypothetical protein